MADMQPLQEANLPALGLLVVHSSRLQLCMHCGHMHGHGGQQQHGSRSAWGSPPSASETGCRTPALRRSMPWGSCLLSYLKLLTQRLEGDA